MNQNARPLHIHVEYYRIDKNKIIYYVCSTKKWEEIWRSRMTNPPKWQTMPSQCDTETYFFVRYIMVVCDRETSGRDIEAMVAIPAPNYIQINLLL